MTNKSPLYFFSSLTNKANQLCTFKWHDTDLSDRIENAFHALALDELRTPFSPAVWERRPQNKSTTDLRQVWFPGNHGNCGGGWEDQNMSNITLACKLPPLFFFFFFFLSIWTADTYSKG